MLRRLNTDERAAQRDLSAVDDPIRFVPDIAGDAAEVFVQGLFAGDFGQEKSRLKLRLAVIVEAIPKFVAVEAAAVANIEEIVGHG